MLIKNKAQVSIFVIIGVLILITMVFLFTMTDVDEYIMGDTDIETEIRSTVEECLEEETDRGSFLLGFQGGRIFIPEHIEEDPFRTLDMGFQLPNWDPNYQEDIPSREDMENDLQRFVEEEAYTCIENSLETFEESHDIDKSENLVVEVDIRDEEVITDASMAINAQDLADDTSITISDYQITLEGNRIGALHEMATKIFHKQSNRRFLEELVVDQMRTSSDYDSEMSIPTEGFNLDCTPNFWTYDQIQNNIRQLNNNNFRYLYFEGTDDSILETRSNNLGEEEENYYERFYTFNLPGETKPIYENFATEVTFPDANNLARDNFGDINTFREFDVTPSSGQIVEPMDFEVDMDGDSPISIPVPCIELYHHLYDLDYDLIMRINDNHDNGELFFQYPQRIQIEDNEPVDEFPTLTPTLIPEEEENTIEDDLYCSEEFREYPLRIFVSDATTGDYLSNAELEYQCVGLTCEIGETERPTYDFDSSITRRHAHPYYEGEFPYCVKGTLTADREGFHEASIDIDTTDELLESNNIIYHEIELYPKKEFEMTQETFLLREMGQVGSTKRVGLDAEENAVYMRVRNETLDFTSQAMWPNDGNELFENIKLLDDPDISYDVTIYYSEDDTFKGMLELESWRPNNIAGNTMDVTIPFYPGGLDTQDDEEEIREFFEYMEDAAEGETFNDYGINLR